jgi:DNA-binding LytR/AlgR family response regulator
MLFKAAICEDDESERNIISKGIECAFELLGHKVQLSSFSNMQRLEVAMSMEVFDVLFLDIIMPNIDGISFAEQLQKKDNQNIPFIVYISNRSDLVFHALKVHPFSFVQKNNFKEEIHKVIADLISRMQMNQQETIVVNYNGRIHCIEISDIMYIDCFNKIQTIHTANRSFVIRLTLKELHERLISHGFIQCHKSFLVNYCWISSIDVLDIILYNDIRIPISKHRRNEVKQRFLELSCMKDVL